ncbi:hypothetical protein OOK36_36300 [Streptomyces sp. NBC_00365]|nr:hypothetical protein [Streptomyces sp. NBC_00365]MCX5094234.1 hypothetical protein [Streptomyces sp. NBC_00365]
MAEALPLDVAATLSALLTGSDPVSSALRANPRSTPSSCWMKGSDCS